ncbi:shikimate dehydrogenase family protein [Robertkochia sediminum]|uniref:shikimate dehydrogenase family protein n=1 Tax=Robertkochia sediminum TaxID=2785326 RepID=UPI0019348F43|nr:hypothetical protein [Robertkochia sediminum]MBL7473411.1 shikimate dehydrogenase [Robertkochia sediminum]
MLTLETTFIYSTSGSASSIDKHNTALQALGLNSMYFTIKHVITPEVYSGILRAPFALGGAVTAQNGLKTSIIPFLDEVDPLAQKTLAVNTVVNRKGKLFGYNTDAFGLKEALIKGMKASEKDIRTAVIYGNGGVSGVAWHVLKELGLEVAFRGRNPEKVLQKRIDLGIDHIREPEGPFDLVVDATPVSGTANFLEAEGLKGLLDGCKMVFCHNMPEKDGKTNYLQHYCTENNMEFIPGSAMYRGQLIKQYSLLLESVRKADGTGVTENDITHAWVL